ncbi:LysR family transcriptional regulator [Saccharopolyspora shandongensis]|uniref:LysR family transcriptional regulator n=1 Tax=Saccharopolyspora shandongensis TaxID=418495 RepID=UPI00343F4607
MDLRQLEYFLAVAEHGGVTRAARALHLAQPSLSDVVRGLERELGTPLFHRVGGGVVLTAAGEALLGPARRALRDRAAARAVLDDLVGLSSGRLDILAWSVVSTYPLAELVAAFRRRHPQITVHITDLRDEDDVGALVRDGHYEIAFAYPAVPDGRDLRVHRLGTHEIHLVLPADVGADWPDPVPVGLLADLPMISVPQNSTMRGRIERVLAVANARTREAAVTEHRDALIPLVLAGVGAAFVSSARARRAAALGLHVRRLDPPIHRTYRLLHRPDGLSPAGRAFVDLALEWARSGDADPRQET